MTTLLLHDWEIVRDAVTKLNGDDVSVSSDIAHAMKLARSGKCNIALVDAEQYSRAVRGLSRHLPVIGLVAVLNDATSNRALLNGALTVLPLRCKIREIREAVKKAKEGSLEKVKGEEVVTFAPTQENVLRGIVRGLNAPEIAKELKLSTGYVSNVIRVLYEKTGVDGGARFTARPMLVKWAVENGWGGD